MRRLSTMTAHNDNPRETLDLLERILEQVESIDRHVEGIRDRLDDDWEALLRPVYDPDDDVHAYD